MEDDAELIPVPQRHKMFKAPFEDEKPAFYTNHMPPGPSEPFVLSGTIQVPYTINRYLRDYQREGVKFMYDNYLKSRGCILGDDMGLGKTIQVISCLAAILQKTGTWQDVKNNRPEFLQSQVPSKLSKVKKVFLIVAPLSVLYNWKDELDTWGHFKTVVVHGVRKEEELDRAKRGRCEIVLTTFETLRLCLDDFNSLDWAAVIVDEVHKIKNVKSQITQAMKEMKCKVRVGLTGTILQNNLEELWCVMDWANPGCLGSLGTFKNRFSEPIEQGQKHSATKRTLAEGRRAIQALAKILSRCFLRRTKALISDQLPKKDDRVVYCSITDFQQAVYRAVLDTDDVKLLLQSSEKCPCSSGRSRKKCCYKLNSDGVSVRHIYFSYLSILRKVANHVALLQSTKGTSKKQEKYVTAICEQVFKKFPDFTKRCKQAAFEAMSDPIYSGKMKVLQKLLNHFIKRKDKVLLFSLSTKLLDVLENYCMAEGLEYRRLDGSTKSKDRIHIVKEFNSSNDINICLVSTMAGGLGLNFVGANVVVLFDPTWNPANDLQAVDRAYRIGQCKDVKVFRLISLGTVEEIIYLRQIYKQQLQSSVIGNENARRYFEAVQGVDGQAGELFGIKNLFRLQTDGTCLTRRILDREGRVEMGIMTASTQATDERVQELQDPVCISSDISAKQENGAVMAYRTSAKFCNAEVLDFSSASEDEDPCGSRSKATYLNAGEEFRSSSGSAANMHLCAMLMKHMTNGMQRSSESSEDSQSDTDMRGLNLEEVKKSKRKTGWFLSSESEEESNEASAISPHGCSGKKACERVCIESEDVEFFDRCYTKAQWQNGNSTNKEPKPDLAILAVQRKRCTEEIESFDSSEDEAPVRKVKFKKSALNSAQKSVQFTGMKIPTIHSRKAQVIEGTSTGTIDTILGGLQEVSYTHSNQKVVGSSRAENRLSRAALRDVFELKKHSQLPANHLHDISETQSEIPQSSESTTGEKEVDMPEGHDKTRLKHQVTHTIETSLHTKIATISVGKTPAAVRKQQLEQMANFFRAKSVQEFAEELVKSNSAQRLSKLCEFYGNSSPELTDVIQKTFPKPVTDPKPRILPLTAAGSMSRKRPTSRRTLVKSVQRPHNETETGTSQEKRIRKTKAQNAKDVHHHCVGQTELKNNCLLLPDSGQNPREATTFNTSTDINLHTQKNTNTCNSSTTTSTNELSPFPRNDQAHKSSNTTLISDLIGDTSILDDLFKQKRSANRPKPTAAPIPSPTERTKNRSKDVWDILNEGNEESINKLTDLSQVEKLCRSIDVCAKSKSESQLESSQLWKKNEKFLWKR